MYGYDDFSRAYSQCVSFSELHKLFFNVNIFMICHKSVVSKQKKCSISKLFANFIYMNLVFSTTIALNLIHNCGCEKL